MRAEQIDQLVRFVKDCGAEEVFSEAVNARGNSLTLTEQVLRENGFWPRPRLFRESASRRCGRPTRRSAAWHPGSHAEAHDDEKLRFLLYPSDLTDQDCQTIRNDDAGVVWLSGKAKA